MILISRLFKFFKKFKTYILVALRKNKMNKQIFEGNNKSKYRFLSERKQAQKQFLLLYYVYRIMERLC